MYLQFFYRGVFFMHFQVMLCVHFSWLCSSNNLIQVLQVNLVHGCFKVIPQALDAEAVLNSVNEYIVLKNYDNDTIKIITYSLKNNITHFHCFTEVVSCLC